MDVLATIKQMLEEHGGKLTQTDLTSLKDQIPTDIFDQLQSLLDGNGDGTLSVDDLTSIDFGSLSEKLGGFDVGGLISDQLGKFLGK